MNGPRDIHLYMPLKLPNSCRSRLKEEENRAEPVSDGKIAVKTRVSVLYLFSLPVDGDLHKM